MSRLVVVPKNKEALKRLDYDIANNEELFQYLIPDNDFFILIENHFFKKINQMLNCCIDDYEDEKILEPEDLNKIKIICQDKAFKSISAVQNIEEKVQQALECKTGVFFYF